MDDPQSVEADDDFSNRRMTRLALKRASRPLENEPEQKKLISERNPGVSKQKPGGLSNKKPRGSSKQKPGGLSNKKPGGSSKQKPGGLSNKKPGGSSKQKPGGLSKTSDNQQQQQQQHREGNDDNQQQQQHREGNDDNQQQHGEGKGVTQVWRSLEGEALKAYQRERKKRWRHLTPEEAENYYKSVWKSEGFDVVAIPFCVKMYGPIRPVNQSTEEQLVIEKCSKSAIARYNKEHKTKYRFVKVIRANYKLGSGIFYYITFVAEEKDVGSAKNFQAFVRYHFKKITVQFCRLEKPPNEGVQYNFKYRMKEKDPNMPKKPSPALRWFLEEFTKKYKEKYHLSEDAIGHAAGGAWTSMTDFEKAPYEEIAKKKMADYRKDLEAYNKRLAEGRVEEEESNKSTVNDKDKDDEIVEE